MSRALLLLLLISSPALALEPKDIFILANKDMKESLEIADYYVSKRKVPKDHVIALSLPRNDDISRADYDKKVVAPLRESLKDRKADVRCLLTVYGVPLRVGPKELTAEEKADADKVRTALNESRKSLTDAEKNKAEAARLTVLRNEVRQLERRLTSLTGDQTMAALDSELMLLWWPEYSIERWVINPLYWQYPEAERKKQPPVLMTCRLDAPTPKIVKQMIDDAIEVEEKGLKGQVYFDARGIGFNPKKPGEGGTGYEGYDESYREAAALLKAGGMDVTIDNRNELFADESCPNAALYSGWYSHANYKNCCTFVKGAVAWHLASSEAVTLHDDKSKVWCPNLLKRGVCATLGPVGEPYTLGFPKPAEFFGFLATGKYTLAEVHARTVMLSSWMVIVIGDPLYNPFAKNPIVKESDVVGSPKGVKVFK